MSMNMDDVELRLLAGMPLDIDGVGKLYSPTLREIVEYGDTRYRVAINAATLDKKNVPEAESNVSDFDYLIFYADNDKEYQNYLYESYKMLFRENSEFQIISDDVVLAIGDSDRYINRDNFFDVRKLIRIVNCLEGIETYHDNPANEKARQLLEKKKLLKQKVNKAKNGDSDSDTITFSDLISVLAGCSPNYNLLNNENNPMSIWNLTIFQFNNAFNRLKLFKDYEVNVQALIHGANSDDVQMQHWISKIKSNE